MTKRILLFIALALALGALPLSAEGLPNPLLFVNPFIGTGGHGHTYPGASAPFGMVQLSPDTRLTGWDGCSAYHYSDSVIYGFSHTHLSGTGCSDYGDILLLPMSNLLIDMNQTPERLNKDVFSHSNEKAEPGFYSVNLKNSGIKVELTTTERVSVHKYNFPDGAKYSYLLIDLEHRDYLLGSELKIIDSVTLGGFRRSAAWAQNQVVYFYIKLSQPIHDLSMQVDSGKNAGIANPEVKVIRSYIEFTGNGNLTVKVALSPVSVDGARKNMEAEAPGWNFDAIRAGTRQKWLDYLNRIQVKGTTDEMTNFYTALYHVALAPNIYQDVDGMYRGRDLRVHKAEGYDYYTVFSLWDTYRAFHPLLTIIDQKRTTDFINTFIAQYEQGGKLPVWELSSNETECMIGYHSVSVIADAMIKGIGGFDREKAYEAAKHSATNFNYRGLGVLDKLGFLTAEKESESVSKTLEYAYDDWCIALMAKFLGKTEDYKYFTQRAQNYKNLFDIQTGFMRPRINGGWYSPFDPFEVNNNYTEANSWQYSFYVPQDTKGFIELFGGMAALEKKLDELFSADTKTTGRDQSDISGLIGQYAHGNEPSHHIAYLYSYAGVPWKTQEKASEIMTSLYLPKPDGLSGNEDCGQMSAWYVMSALGFYPVCPGSEQYTFGSPLFESAIINLENGKKFIVRCTNKSPENIYIKSAKMNGKTYNLAYIKHSDIMNGGELEFVMDSKPNKSWAVEEKSLPVTDIKDNVITPAPYLVNAPRSFKDKVSIEFGCIDKNARIRFTLDGSEPNTTSAIYQKPLTIDSSVTIKFYAEAPGKEKSKIISASMKKVNHDWLVSILSKFSNQYTAGGPGGLVDGIYGEDNWRLGGWQGHIGNDFVAVIDLRKLQKINKVSCRFLQDIRSWIWMPKEIVVYSSFNGTDFKEIGRMQTNIPEDDMKMQIKKFNLEFENTYTQYIKVVGVNIGPIPAWHDGAGEPAFIFIDEITVEP
jgi:predicted alpha-1,2-mannosidase